MQQKYLIKIDGINIECFFDNEKDNINDVVKEAFKEYLSKSLELKE